jgi:hypothetical protein
MMRRAGRHRLRARKRHGRAPLVERASLAHRRAGFGLKPAQLGHRQGPKASPVACDYFLKNAKFGKLQKIHKIHLNSKKYETNFVG